MQTINRRLASHGMILFLLGLFTGFAEPNFANVRMGLAAHLEGVMNGIFLLALAGVWAGVELTPTPQAIAYWTLLYGTYVNWAMTGLAAIWGTAALSPITGPTHPAAGWKETVVTAGFMSVGIAIVAASALLLWGFRKRASRFA